MKARLTLNDLSAEVSWPSGTWFILSEDETTWGRKERRPYIFPDGIGRSCQFAQALPKTTQPPQSDEVKSVDFVHHLPHSVCDASKCGLDKEGWVRPVRVQVNSDQRDKGRWSCTERIELGRIQSLNLEQATDL